MENLENEKRVVNNNVVKNNTKRNCLIGAVAVLAVGGCAYLAKKWYDKKCAEKLDNLVEEIADQINEEKKK